MTLHFSHYQAEKTYKRPRTILKHVRDYFERNPRNFRRGGRIALRPGADDGYARCALGALDHYAADDRSFQKALSLLHEQTPSGSGIVAVNDCKGRKAVIDIIDKALAS